MLSEHLSVWCTLMMIDIVEAVGEAAATNRTRMPIIQIHKASKTVGCISNKMCMVVVSR